MKTNTYLVCMVFFAFTQIAHAAQPTSPLAAQSIATVPTVKPTGEWDGTPHAIWANVPWNNIATIFKGEETGFGDHGASLVDDFAGRFKVAHDANKVYFLFDITDELVIQDPAPAQHWVGDKVEIYFGLPGYDPALGAKTNHSRQFAIKAQIDPTAKGEEGSANYAPASDALETNGVTYSYYEGAAGYMLQVSIDKAIALEAVPSNTAVGFDICVADNDEVGTGVRYRKSWFNDGNGPLQNNELWASMAGAGKLILNATTGFNRVQQAVGYVVNNNILNVYTDSNVTISIYNITGKSVITSINTNKVNVANLNAGIYVATVTTQDGKMLGIFRFLK